MLMSLNTSVRCHWRSELQRRMMNVTERSSSSSSSSCQFWFLFELVIHLIWLSSIRFPFSFLFRLEQKDKTRSSSSSSESDRFETDSNNFHTALIIREMRSFSEWTKEKKAFFTPLRSSRHRRHRASRGRHSRISIQTVKRLEQCLNTGWKDKKVHRKRRLFIRFFFDPRSLRDDWQELLFPKPLSLTVSIHFPPSTSHITFHCSITSFYSMINVVISKHGSIAFHHHARVFRGDGNLSERARREEKSWRSF